MRIWHQSFTDLTMVPLYSRTLAEHATEVTADDTEVVVHGLKPDTYGAHFSPIDTIRHRYLEFLNEAQICEAALTAEEAGYDAVAIGCFFDPGLRQARSLVDIPVIGLAETCMLVACSLGHRFGLVTLNDDQKRQYQDVVRHYELDGRFAAAVPMDPPIDEYTLEAGEEELRSVGEDFERACGRVIALGAEVIIPADGVLNEFVWRRGLSRWEGATIMDAIGVLFQYAEFMVASRESLGLTVSRAGWYAKPTDEMLSHARRVAGTTALAEEEFSQLQR